MSCPIQTKLKTKEKNMSFLLSNYMELGFDGLIAVNGGCDQTFLGTYYKSPSQGNAGSNIGVRYTADSGTCNGIPKPIQFVPIKATEGYGPDPRGYWATLK